MQNSNSSDGTNAQRSTEAEVPTSRQNIANTHVVGSQSPVSPDASVKLKTPLADKQFLIQNGLSPQAFNDFNEWMESYCQFVSNSINVSTQNEWQKLKELTGLSKCHLLLDKGKIGIFYDLGELRSLYTEMSSEYM